MGAGYGEATVGDGCGCEAWFQCQDQSLGAIPGLHQPGIWSRPMSELARHDEVVPVTGEELARQRL